MYTFLHEMRFAFRQLRRNIGFTAVTVAMLALGIGAATAVFSLVDTVLLHPLPFAQPERIVALSTLSQIRAGAGAAIPEETSYPNFFDWRDRAHSFEAISSWQGNSFTLALPGTTARRIDGMAVSSDFFRVLGIQPALGRGFIRQEEQAGNRSVIISHSFWQSALNGNPGAIGANIQLSDEPYTVIGILPAAFQFPNAPDAQVWVTPAHAMEGKNPSGQQRGWSQLSVIGRLAPGISLPQARAEMQAIQQALAKQYPEDDARETSVGVVPELQDIVGDVQRPLHILFGAVCFLLLIACANVAGLLLTRTAARRSQFALRAALGASRTQLVRQILIESLTLSALGGVVGFALASAALHAAPTFLPDDLPRIHELAINPRAFVFAFAVSLITGLLFGVTPAWRNSNLDPAIALRDTTRSSTATRSQNRLQSILVIAETALGLTLLIGAGLFIRSFDRLLNVEPGFNPHHLLTFRVGMPPKRFRDERILHLSQQLQTRFAALPGVQQSTFGYPMPFSGTDMNLSFSIAGSVTAPGDEPSARLGVVSGNFFQSLQIPVLRGRLFTTAEEQSTGAPVAIVNQAFAAKFFPGQDVIGKHIASDADSGSDSKPHMREIIGIVGNTSHGSLSEEAAAEYYLPFAQAPLGPPVFTLRVAGDPAAYVQTVRAAVAQQDPTLPVYAVRTDLLTRSTAQQRFQTILLSAFAVLALILAATGLYALLSYMVVQRILELGLRLALGAQRSTVLSMILYRGLLLCAIGMAVGLAASTALTRFLATLLFHTPPLDVITFAGMAVLLLAISAAACLLPAWRASRLNPNDILRQQ